MPDETLPPPLNQTPRTRRRQSALWGVLLLLCSSYVDMLLGLIEVIYVMNRIGPLGKGLMALVDIFNKWLSNAHLGTLHGVSKQLPMALGRKDEARAQELEDVGVTAVLGLGLLGSLGMLAWALLGPRLGGTTREVLAIGAGLVWCGHTFNIYRIVLRSWGTFTVIAMASVVTTVVEFGLEIVGAYYFGVVGATLGWLGANLAQLLYLHYHSRLRIRLRWNWPMVRYLIRTGLPLTAIVFSDVLLLTVDSLVVLRLLKAYNLGLYWVAASVAGYVKKIPESAGFVLMPRIWEKFGAKNGEVHALRDEVVTPTLAAATVMPVLSGLLFMIIPGALALVVPKFVPAAFAAQVLCMGGAFLALPLAANGLLVAMNREFQVVLCKLPGAAVIAAGSYWTLTHGGGLGQVAMCAVLGYALSSALLLTAALRHFYPQPLRLAQELAICHLPFLWALGALKAAGLLARLLGATPRTWSEVLLRMALFLLLCVPMLWYGNLRTGVLSRLRLLLREKLARPGAD